MTEQDLMTQIAQVCDRAAKGDLEARIVPLPSQQGWGTVCTSINSLLDVIDSYVRESQAVLECCSRHEFHRPILVRAMKGAYRGAAVVINNATVEMRDTQLRREEAERQREALVREVSSSAHTVAAACEQLTSSSREISLQLNDSAGLTEQAVAQSHLAKDAVGALSENSNRIQEVVQIINGIAGQTRLLALNATIEAAHAGESGRGFAVVANEVRSLSRHTQTATGTIGDQVKSIASVTGSVEKAIGLINSSIDSLNLHVRSIAATVSEQVTATNEIAGQMNRVSATLGSITTASATYAA